MQLDEKRYRESEEEREKRKKTNIVMIVDCDKSRKSSRREEVGCIVIKDEGKGSFGKHRKNRRN